MTVNILLFGVAREIVGKPSLQMEFEDKPNISSLKKELLDSYPSIGDLQSIMFAVNQEYADDNTEINSDDEVAVIPPVSGG